jgi:hypothetical protein
MLAILLQEIHRPSSVPGGEGICFVLTLAVRELDLQDHVRAIPYRGREHQRGVRTGERVADLQIPPSDRPLHQAR